MIGYVRVYVGDNCDGTLFISICFIMLCFVCNSFGYEQQWQFVERSISIQLN